MTAMEYGPAALFYLFGAVALAGGLSIVLSRNPMFGAMGLLATLLGVAGLFLLRAAEFVAAVQVFVYGGGVMVLFVFVIMLIRGEEMRARGKYVPGALVAVAVALGVVTLLTAAAVSLRAAPAGTLVALREIEGEAVGNTAALAWRLYRDFLLPFEIASIYLVVAMVGAVVLAQRWPGEQR